MKHKSAVERLTHIVRDEVDTFSSNIMVKIGDRYQLFDTYTVAQNSHGTCSVTKIQQDSQTFSRMRSAVSWCIADKFKRYETARAISDLDSRCAAIKADLEVTKFTASRTHDIERKQILLAKISGKQNTLRSLENQLTKCVNLAKYWQIKGFIRDETARPRNPKNTR